MDIPAAERPAKYCVKSSPPRPTLGIKAASQTLEKFDQVLRTQYKFVVPPTCVLNGFNTTHPPVTATRLLLGYSSTQPELSPREVQINEHGELAGCHSLGRYCTFMHQPPPQRRGQCRSKISAEVRSVLGQHSSSKWQARQGVRR